MKVFLVRHGETDNNATRVFQGHTPVLCVSHGKAIDLFTRHILGLDVMAMPAYGITNTSVNIFTSQDGVWEVVTLNEVRHLETL